MKSLLTTLPPKNTGNRWASQVTGLNITGNVRFSSRLSTSLKKFKAPFETRSELTSAFWNAFHFFTRYGIVYFFSFIRLAYFIMWWRFRMSLVKHWSSHRAQIWSYVNSSSSYFAVTFLINQSSSLSSCQIALFSILFPPSLGITITWPNRPATINGFNRSLTRKASYSSDDSKSRLASLLLSHKSGEDKKLVGDPIIKIFCNVETKKVKESSSKINIIF